MSEIKIRIPKQSASNAWIGAFVSACLCIPIWAGVLAWEHHHQEEFIYVYRLSKWYNNPYTGQQIIQHDYVYANRVEVVGNCFRLWNGSGVVAAECGEVRIIRTTEHESSEEDTINKPGFKPRPALVITD